jgi:hypothetical protein
MAVVALEGLTVDVMQTNDCIERRTEVLRSFEVHGKESVS